MNEKERRHLKAQREEHKDKCNEEAMDEQKLEKRCSRCRQPTKLDSGMCGDCEDIRIIGKDAW